MPISSVRVGEFNAEEQDMQLVTRYVTAITLFAGAATVRAGGFELDWHTVDGGGGGAVAGGLTLSGTIGQPDAHLMSGSGLTLVGGFWAIRIVGPVCGLCGDSNCDGVVSVGDIGYFVTAVAQGAPAWSNLFPGGQPPCDFLCANDTNGNDSVTVADIGFFVAVITGSGACP